MGSQTRKIARRMDRDEFKVRNGQNVTRAKAQGGFYPEASSPAKLQKKLRRLALKRSAYARFVTCVLMRAAGLEAEPVLVEKVETSFQKNAVQAQIVANSFSPSQVFA